MIRVTFYEKSFWKIKTIDNSYLVSLNVRSLYTSIPNSDFIKAAKTSLEKFPWRAVATKVIATFLSLILTLSNFAFNGKSYLQTKNCAMGIISAPACANIFLYYFGRKYVYSFLDGLFLSYLRFIGNIFFTWTGSRDQLITLLTIWIQSTTQ